MGAGGAHVRNFALVQKLECYKYASVSAGGGGGEGCANARKLTADWSLIVGEEVYPYACPFVLFSLDLPFPLRPS